VSPDPSPPLPARRAPGVLIHRLCGPLAALLARDVARIVADDLIELDLEPDEVREGGMVTISMWVPVPCPGCANEDGDCARCGNKRSVDDLFAAWLAVRPGVADGTLLKPSALLPGMKPIAFRVRVS
jgi:hypothetical protein